MDFEQGNELSYRHGSGQGAARAARFGHEWQHDAGTLAAREAEQQASNVYRGNILDHALATPVGAAPGAPWVRLDGFATADQLLAELPALHASR